MTCPYCAKRSLKKINEYTSPTCGNSSCQEADFHANRERNALKRQRKSRR